MLLETKNIFFTPKCWVVYYNWMVMTLCWMILWIPSISSRIHPFSFINFFSFHCYHIFCALQSLLSTILCILLHLTNKENLLASEQCSIETAAWCLLQNNQYIGCKLWWDIRLPILLFFFVIYLCCFVSSFICMMY